MFVRSVVTLKKQRNKVPLAEEKQYSTKDQEEMLADQIVCKLYSLGHTFRTDVVRIDFYETTDHIGELSVLYTLLEGISRTLKIERSDIDGCVQKLKRRMVMRSPLLFSITFLGEQVMYQEL